jgi:hypothetical protein
LQTEKLRPGKNDKQLRRAVEQIPRAQQLSEWEMEARVGFAVPERPRREHPQVNMILLRPRDEGWNFLSDHEIIEPSGSSAALLVVLK